MGPGFHEKLRPIADGYDVVIIDCPPGHGELQRAALMTADVAAGTCRPPKMSDQKGGIDPDNGRPSRRGSEAAFRRPISFHISTQFDIEFAAPKPRLCTNRIIQKIGEHEESTDINSRNFPNRGRM